MSTAAAIASPAPAAERVPISLAQLKRELTVGRAYYLVDRRGANTPPYGAFARDNHKRTVARIQTNAIASSVDGQKELTWLRWTPGDKAFRTPRGFVLECTSKALTLTYEWATPEADNA